MSRETAAWVQPVHRRPAIAASVRANCMAMVLAPWRGRRRESLPLGVAPERGKLARAVVSLRRWASWAATRRRAGPDRAAGQPART
jgi:hypothetical protein